MRKNSAQILIGQWQYWFWFWMTVIIALYIIVIIRIISEKQENLNPVMNTSMRSHGKWGDFLAAIIPLSWCGNILVNSNFILRMIEWQNEGTLFTIRIQGKQWYWVYKFSNDVNFKLNNVYINVGNNNWFKTTNSSKTKLHFNNSLLSFLFDLEFKELYKKWDKEANFEKSFFKNFQINYNSKFLKNDNFFSNINLISSDFNNFFINQHDKNIILNNNSNQNFVDINNININTDDDIIDTLYNSDSSDNNNNNNTNDSEENSKKKKKSILKKNKLYFKLINLNQNAEPTSITNIFDFNNFNNFNISFFENDHLNNENIAEKNLKFLTNNFTIKLYKGILNKNNIELLNTINNLQKNIFFNFKISNSNILQKLSQIEQFWGFFQKKYKKLRIFAFPNNTKYSNKSYHSIGNFLNKENFNKYYLYNGVKNNKYKNELIPVNLAKRLLRTKKTLVLPAHVNLSIITSSYDVVHSWFVPGLGLKMDCVPGRSTHHTLRIENVGFYYGQCAEICGRYHHHMPIRICALSFEHFLLWWKTKGLPKIYRSKHFIEQKEKSKFLKFIN